MLSRDEERRQFEAWRAEERWERWLLWGSVFGVLCAGGLIVWGLVVVAQWLLAP
jgi:hypothetical protein